MPIQFSICHSCALQFGYYLACMFPEITINWRANEIARRLLHECNDICVA